MKINKKLLFSSFFIILLLVIGTASAADSDNISDVTSIASSDVNELEIDAETDNNQSTVLANGQDSDIVSAVNPNEEKIIANITNENNTSTNVETGDESNSGENILSASNEMNSTILAASTPSLSNIINQFSNLGNVANIGYLINSLKNVEGININIKEITTALSKLNNLNLPDVTDALNILKKYNVNIKDVANTVNTLKDNPKIVNIAKAINTLNKDDINISDIAKTLNTLSKDFNISMPDITDALNTLKDNNINIKDIAKTLNTLKDYNISVPDIINALENISDRLNPDMSNIIDELSNISDKYNFNISDIEKAIDTLKDNNINIKDLANALSDLNKKYNFNISDIEKAIDTLKDNNINIKDLTDVLNILKDNDINITDITKALDTLKDNNINIQDLINALSELSKKYDFNISDIIAKLSDPNLNISNIEDLLNELLKPINEDNATVLDATFVAPNRVISVANAISGYDYKFILRDENGSPIANKDVLVIFNDKTQTVKTDEKGWGTVTLHANAADKYTLVLTFVDKKFNPAFKTATITLIKEKTRFVAPDRAVYVQQMARGYKYSAILKDQNGNALANKKVLFIFDGKKTVVTTDEKGWATVTLKAVEAGTKTLTIKFAGTASCYYETSITKTIKIILEPSQLEVKDVTFSSGSKAKQVTATLKAKSGNPINGAKVVMTVNGKTYTAITNNQGIATFSIDLNKAGTFSATTKFANSRFFIGSSTTSKIRIV